MKQFALAALLIFTASTSLRADTPPTLSNRFEEDAGAWTAIGATGKVSVTHDAESVKEGKGALKFNYTVTKGEMNALALMTPDGALAKAKSLTFQMKAFVAMPVIVALTEKGGGRYVATFTLPAGQWQSVALGMDDFTLTTDKNDPKDPDGKLDMDAVESIAVADLSQLFVGVEGPTAGFVSVKSGPRAFIFDDFAARPDPLPAVPAPSSDTLLLDPPSRPQIAWIGIGEATLSRPSKGGLQIAYRQSKGKLAGVFQSVGSGGLTGKSQIIFTMTATQPATLIFHLEEAGGGKYDAVISAKPGSPQPVTLKISDFKASDDSKDANGKLDMDKVTQIGLLDVSSLLDETASSDMTLTVSDLKAVK